MMGAPEHAQHTSEKHLDMTQAVTKSKTLHQPVQAVLWHTVSSYSTLLWAILQHVIEFMVSMLVN